MNTFINREVLAPTGVTHCAAAYLTHVSVPANDQAQPLPNLVVARATVLEIYRLRGGAGGSDGDGEGVRLELLGRHRLHGVVESLAVLRAHVEASQRDALLLTFRDAKLAVLDWDEGTDSMRSSSLHYFEGDASLKAGRRAFALGPRLVTDPQGRCAAVAMFRHQLAILPAMGGDELELLLQDTNGAAAAGPSAATTVGNSYVVNLAKLGIKEVRDLAFLHRYNEPVLLLLHEADPTWAGRYRDRKDTMQLTALSLNTAQKRHPRLWSASGLPSDAYKLLPAPAGGALVLCQNLILYHAQGSSCGLAVNGLANPGVVPPRLETPQYLQEDTSDAAAKYARKYVNNVHPEAAPAMAAEAPRAEGFDFEADAAHATWLADTTLLLALKTGQLLQLHLLAEGGTIRRMQLSKCGGAPPTSCAATLAPDLLFLGSWVGDSLLIRAMPLQAKESHLSEEDRLYGIGTANGAVKDAAEQAAQEGPPAKRRRLQGGEGEEALGDADEDDEAAIYDSGEAGALASAAVRYSLKVADSLLGVAPVRDLACGEASSSATADWAADSRRGPQQLVAAVGHGRSSGALAVLRRGLVPELITDVPLPDVKGLWAVHHNLPGSSDTNPEHFHAYLLISSADGTKVLQTGEELQEVTDRVDFVVDAPTLAAGNLAGGALIVQVHAGGLLLLEGATRKVELSVAQLLPAAADDDLRIIGAAIAEPYVLLRLSDGAALLLQESNGALMPVEAATAPLTTEPTVDFPQIITAATLYVDATGWLTAARKGPDRAPDAQPATYCIAARANGLLQLYALPSMEVAFAYTNLAQGGAVLDSGGVGAHPELAAGEPPVTVDELRCECFAAGSGKGGGIKVSNPAARCERPVLLALLSDATLLAYRAFSPQGAGIKFARMPLDTVGYGEPAAASTSAAVDSEEVPPASSRIVRFDALGEGTSWSGVFVGGAQPLWLVAWRGGLVPHAMEVEGPVSGFTPFHNVNCPQGFISAVGAGRGSALKICQMPVRARLEGEWTVQKVPLRATPHSLAYYPEAKLYALLTSRQVPWQEWLPAEPGGNAHAAYSYAAAEAAAKDRGTEERAEVRLVVPGLWTTAWRHQLGAGEVALCVRALHLRSTQDASTQPLLAVGTSFSAGEDYPCLGRLLLFVVTKEERPTRPAGEEQEPPKWSGDLVYQREFRGPVTAVAALPQQGLLIVAVGNKLEAHAWDGARLARTAFFDAPVLITSLSVIKSYIVFGDVHKGTYFVMYQEASKRLTQLSKDFDNSDTAAVECIINGNSLCFVEADGGANLHVLQFDQKHPDTLKGKRLLPLASMHVGHHISRFLRLRLTATEEARWAAFYGTLSGSLGCVAQVWDDAMKKPLAALQAVLVTEAPHMAGLNPDAFRRRVSRTPAGLGGGQHFGKPRSGAAFLDYSSLAEYQFLPRSRQVAIAAKTGSSRETLLAYIAEIAARTAFF